MALPIRYMILVSVCGLLLGAVAGLCRANGSVTAPDDKPVVVGVGAYVVDVGTISETDNTFTVELDVIARWRDARLAFDASEEGSDQRIYIGAAAEAFRSSIWNAQMTAANAVGPLGFGNQKIMLRSDGTVLIEVRVNATLRADLDYREFPFDRQVLPVRIESYAWNATIVRVEPIGEQMGFDPSFDLPEWAVEGVATAVSEVRRPRDPVPFSRMSFDIAIARKSGFYIWKIFLPLLIIVSISWVTFWMSSETLGRRAGVSVTGILTVIAYQFIVSGFIPRLSYLTALDKITLFSIVLIASTLIVSIVVDSVQARRGPGPALKIDRACRLAFPLVYFAVVFIAIR